jgi:hypothetical protein
MGSNDFGGGLWVLVAINSVIFIGFAATFFHPHTKRDWRVMGAYSAFIVALFTEMYGFPLTVYVLSGWLGSTFPALAPSHAGGHLLNDLIGWQGDPHLSPFHLASYLVMGAGFLLLAKAWPVLWLHAASAIRRLPADHGGLPAPVADASHAGDVPRSCLRLHQAGHLGGA